MKPAFTMSVIFTTYNSIDWLEKVLWGFEFQTDKNFELIIADDGSSHETRDFIERYRQHSLLTIRHVWQEDKGFRKCEILNKAIVLSRGDYLVFTDGDCIPRSDFIEVHRREARPGYFLSGGYFKVPMLPSLQIQREQVASGVAFDIGWLVANGYPRQGKRLRLIAKGRFAKLCNWLIPTAKTWNGHNASGWRSDIVRVNGFDQRMHYGGEDCEMGDRLKFTGIKVKRVRYTAICIHLDHARGYVNEALRQKNRAIRDETISRRSTRTEYGISR